MKRVDLLDRLHRAYEMEEVMAGLLMDAVATVLSAQDLPEDRRARAAELLSSVQQDTLSHKKAVSELIDRLSKEQQKDAF